MSSSGEGSGSSLNRQPTIHYSAHTVEKANKARITIENFYTNFLLQQDEREERFKQTEAAIGKLIFVYCDVSKLIMTQLFYFFFLF